MAAFKILRDFAKLVAGPLRTFGSYIHDCMSKNATLFPTPPISMDALGAQIDKYGGLIAESKDGSRKVIAARYSEGSIL